MTVLLDTNMFLWILSDDSRLTGSAREVFLNEEHRVVFSIAGLWEIFIKLRSGKLTVDSGDPPAFFKSQLQENAIAILGITMEHVAGTLALPMIHRDPFDRLIIAQALHEGVPVLSSDPVFAEYGVKNLF
ncbi:MAG: type II toxin-antitoxin system VapC family toxin [Spirochaetaceae bacterium]|nr:MAG: type II toxin-antitoxin system VapC family toxin [Spirochaetaceae bacterium]